MRLNLTKTYGDITRTS